MVHSRMQPILIWSTLQEFAKKIHNSWAKRHRWYDLNLNRCWACTSIFMFRADLHGFPKEPFSKVRFHARTTGGSWMLNACTISTNRSFDHHCKESERKRKFQMRKNLNIPIVQWVKLMKTISNTHRAMLLWNLQKWRQKNLPSQRKRPHAARLCAWTFRLRLHVSR